MVDTFCTRCNYFFSTFRNRMNIMENMQEVQRPATSTYPKVAIQWLNQALCIYQS